MMGSFITYRADFRYPMDTASDITTGLYSRSCLLFLSPGVNQENLLLHSMPEQQLYTTTDECCTRGKRWDKALSTER